ncbi:hypothetical protein HNE_0969 [Hyphomonas neptunium ATCC 15444]|uniref:Uncharacterized protein n=1 Tax=Hyphomonas neptunium (strain ATCC 15444) TaxID=228405 RepID=Q0C3J9_HYPNA|nr:hypothetical protein HNE_0969 [Hyphomonas neptunium ATCC 15444]
MPNLFIREASPNVYFQARSAHRCDGGDSDGWRVAGGFRNRSDPCG